MLRSDCGQHCIALEHFACPWSINLNNVLFRSSRRGYYNGVLSYTLRGNSGQPCHSSNTESGALTPCRIPNSFSSHIPFRYYPMWLQVFTTLVLLTDTQFTMGKFLSLSVQSASESWVSIKRIESVLLMEVSGAFSGRVLIRVIRSTLVSLWKPPSTIRMNACRSRLSDRAQACKQYHQQIQGHGLVWVHLT